MQKAIADKRAAAQKRATKYQYGADPDNEAYLDAVTSRHTSAASTPAASTPAPVIDEDERFAQRAEAEFLKKKRHYEEMKRQNNGRLPFRHEVEWMKIDGAEKVRQKKLELDRALAIEGDEDLFPSAYRTHQNETEEGSDHTAGQDTTTLSRKRSRLAMPRKEPKPLSMQAAELHSMHVALEADKDRPKKKKKRAEAEEGSAATRKASKAKSIRVSKSNGAANKVVQGGKQPRKRKRQVEDAVRQVSSFFESNVFEQQASADAPDQPTFNNNVKAGALKELIASIPLADKIGREDINIILAATKEFDGRGAVKADKGLWRVKGMSTSLKPYQVLGTAFMRRRERDIHRPSGGLMADQMGLGKTLQMLANIVNGRPPKHDAGPRTTLLVASPALIEQWRNEIEAHTNCNLTMMRYCSGSRIDSNQTEKTLGNHDIVLTTYGEVMKSYPKNEPPIECQTVEEKMAWWKGQYETKRGALHRMMFLRIVLDEAQAIKNHSGRTSIACRALMAQHKWALSGTPILNSLTELYPYFKFLDVPHTGSFKIFKSNYCDTGNAENTERLMVRLSQFMIRRTHADKMFGAPILKLPQADQSTYWCEFNSVERCIYEIVEKRFVDRMNKLQRSDELEKSYGNALVMLLRLRQLTAHVLMLQFVMRDLLEYEDIEKIKEIVKDQAADSNSRRGRTILAVRKQLIDVEKEQKKKSAADAAAGRNLGRHLDLDNEETRDNEEDNLDDMDEFDLTRDAEGMVSASQRSGEGIQSGRQFGKDYNFKPFLNALSSGESWQKAKERAHCSWCGNRPNEPYITSCGHLICKEPCLEQSDLEAAEKEEQYSACKACGSIPRFIHPCDVDEDETAGVVAQGTRSKAKQRDTERKRLDREDISANWLASLGDEVLPSAKTIAVKAQILNWRKENAGVKVIIYTQFLAMIRILARVCQNEGWQTEQYHGKMSFKARDKALGNFADDAEVSILLASLRCGGLGLNLTMASKVIMIDPWWNTASEQQAFCRVFRIGQKEQTYMSRMCVQNTVDERLIRMQDRKQEEIDGVMEDKDKYLKRMDMRELMRLFGNLREDKEGRPYILVDNPDPRGGFRADEDHEGFADDE
ncbi:SNF2 family N-terminal domain-containing protein [Ampelomyces quisqualis]|uniref:SNF2 family N-terminal domain-containing protein n=1 Tax=Ampelomyces quisqualis TaxID=50730 RepID=A0A6A5QUX2_AMPQU|nr:SNF2 family N-terminal domain-containing protein [Ampelomyces quisqualis]